MKSCTKCNLILDFTEFNKKNKSSSTGYQSQCRKCNNKVNVEWNKKTKDVRRHRLLHYSYGLSLGAFDTMMQEQEGRCLICQFKFDMNGEHNQKAMVDHCHETGQIRGLLCNMCNQGIARFRDNPEIARRAATYLETAKKKTPVQVTDVLFVEKTA